MKKNNLKTDWKPYLDPYKRHWQKTRHLQYGGVQNCSHRWPALHRISPYRQWRLAHCSCRIFHLSNDGILFQVRERTAGRRRGWTCHEKGHSWSRGFLNGKIFMALAEIGDIIPTFAPYDGCNCYVEYTLETMFLQMFTARVFYFTIYRNHFHLLQTI